MSKAEENRKALEKIYGAFASGDMDLWQSFFDEESVLIEAESLPYGGTFKGPEEILGALAKITECWDDFTYEVKEVFANEDSVMAYGIISGTGKATGRRVTLPLAERWLLEGGIVREITAIYFDTAAMRAALIPAV